MQVARRARRTPLWPTPLRAFPPLDTREGQVLEAPGVGAARRVYEVGVWRVMSILCDDISNRAVD